MSAAFARSIHGAVSNTPQRFRYEADLVTVLTHSLALFAETQREVVWALEVRVGGASVDLMLAVPDVPRLKRRVDSGTRLTGAHLVVMLALDFHTPRTWLQVYRRIGTSERQVKSLLADLLDTHHIVSPDHTGFLRGSRSRPYFTKIISVEAKLSKWPVVLRQAARNKLFSNYSYAALDETRSAPARSSMAEFASAGLGLATVAADTQSVNMAWQPTSSEPSSRIMHWLAMEELARRTALGESQRFGGPCAI